MSNVKNFDETWIKGDRLGKGGQGTTYKCSKKDSPQVIGALKTLNNQKDMERRRRMQREVNFFDNFSSSWLPKIYDFNT